MNENTPRSIRFTDEEWERLAKAAEKAGTTVSQLVRFRALRVMTTPIYAPLAWANTSSGTVCSCRGINIPPLLNS